MMIPPNRRRLRNINCAGGHEWNKYRSFVAKYEDYNVSGFVFNNGCLVHPTTGDDSLGMAAMVLGEESRLRLKRLITIDINLISN